MGEFLEYLRTEHSVQSKPSGVSPLSLVPTYESDDSDLSADGALHKRISNLEPNQKLKLNKFVAEMRKIQEWYGTSHDCNQRRMPQYGIDNKRILIKM
jgi:hypothetical protein